MAKTVRRDTRNPFRLGYARARYAVGIAVQRLLEDRREQFPRLHRWAHASESRQNCIVDPWLGGAVRLHSRQHALGRKMVEIGSRLREASEGRTRGKLRVEYERLSTRAAAASLAYARHRLLAYPDDIDALHTVQLHERLSQARA